jgi:hypothetical protein
MKKIPVTDEVLTVDFAEMLRFTQQALGKVPEFRKAKGRQIGLEGALTLVVVAMAAGRTSYRTMARFAKQREPELMPLLGLKRAPSYSTFRRILKGVAPQAMREVLQRTSAKMLEDKAHQVGRETFLCLPCPCCCIPNQVPEFPCHHAGPDPGIVADLKGYEG